MRTLKLFFCLILLLVLSSGMVMAQCPNGKTAFVWVNGVLGKSSADWTNQVTGVAGIQNKFLTSHPSLSPCVVFDSSFNSSGGHLNTFLGTLAGPGGDLAEFVNLTDLQDVQNYLIGQNSNFINNSKAQQLYMAGVLQFQKDQITQDADWTTLHQKVQDWWNQGYRVVLVGHSEGNVYTNLEYGDRVLNNGGALLNQNKLAVVAIATPASNVADGRNMYTTQCADFIYLAPNKIEGAPGALPYNVSNGIFGCLGKSVLNFFTPRQSWLGIGDLLGTFFGAFTHHDLDKYLADNSNTQKQIYRQLEDSLPDPGCGGDVSCYLKDNFFGNYINNWLQIDSSPTSSSTIDTASNLGTLRMDSHSFTTLAVPGVTFPGHLTLRSRRIFTGVFTSGLEYNSVGTGTNSIALVNVKDNTPAAQWVLAPVATNTNWYPITFVKTDTQITLYINYVSQGSVSTTASDGYYLDFDLQGDNTLQVRNLSVVAGALTPTLLTASCSASPNPLTIGQMGTFIGVWNGGTGSKTGIWGGVVSGTGPTTTYTASPTVGRTSRATYTVTDSGIPQQTAVANCQVTNVAPPPVAPTTGTVLVTTNQSSPYNIGCTLNGVSFTAPATLSNQAIGSKTLSCTPAAGLTVSSISPSATQTLSAGGVASFNVNLTTTPPPPPPFTVSCSFAQNPGTLNQYDLLTIFQNGGVQPINYAVNGVSIGPSNVFNIFLSTAGILTDSVSATDGTGRQATNSCSVNVIAPPPTTGTVVITTTGNIGVNCTVNGAFVSAPNTLANQSVGSKTLVCTAPIGYAINTITPFTTQALSAGSTIQFMVNLVVSTPAPILNSVTVNTQPKVNLPISISLFGSNFVNGAYGYTCTSTQTNTCTPWTTTFVNSSKLNLTFQRNTAGTVYLLVINPDSKMSGFLTMVVIN